MHKILAVFLIMVVMAVIVLTVIPLYNIYDVIYAEPNATKEDVREVLKEGKNYIIVAIAIAMVGWSVQKIFLREDNNDTA